MWQETEAVVFIIVVSLGLLSTYLAPPAPYAITLFHREMSCLDAFNNMSDCSFDSAWAKKRLFHSPLVEQTFASALFSSYPILKLTTTSVDDDQNRGILFLGFRSKWRFGPPDSLQHDFHVRLETLDGSRKHECMQYTFSSCLGLKHNTHSYVAMKYTEFNL